MHDILEGTIPKSPGIREFEYDISDNISIDQGQYRRKGLQAIFGTTFIAEYTQIWKYAQCRTVDAEVSDGAEVQKWSLRVICRRCSPL